MTQKNNNQLATAQRAGVSLSIPNLDNNKVQTREAVEITTKVPKYEYLNNIINPFSVGFSEPIKFGDYLKIEEGDNLVRILTPAIIGIEWWTEELDKESGKIKKRPNRLPLDLALSDCPVIDWSYFNACYVWNYKAQKVQILSTTKRGIINGIKNLINKPKWGEITDYDINITKTLKTPNDPKSAEYSVTPEPKTMLEDEVLTKWQQSSQCYEYLTLLYQGLDPFEKLRAGEDMGELLAGFEELANKAFKNNQLKVNV
jgi:hypothetical protein